MKPRYGVAPHTPAPATHHGPPGPVRAHQWHGSLGSARTFLDSGGSVAYHLDGPALVVDGWPARPGDWLVWHDRRCHVVGRDDFDALYRPL